MLTIPFWRLVTEYWKDLLPFQMLKMKKDDVASVSPAISITSESDIEMVPSDSITSTSPNSVKPQDSPKAKKCDELEGRLSRYGRHQKPKSLMGDMVPTEIMRFVSKSGSKVFKNLDNTEFRRMKTPTKLELNYQNQNVITEEEDSVKHREIMSSNTNHPENVTEVQAATNIRSSIDELSSEVDSGRGSSIDFDVEIDFTVGTIYWAQYKAGHYWPCLICPDPLGDTIMSSENKNKISAMVHVKYFADKGRRSWIFPKKLVLYKGLQHLQQNYPMQKRMKTVKNFEASVIQADECLQLPLEKRLDFIVEKAEIQIRATQKSRASGGTSELNRSTTPESPSYEDLSLEDPNVIKKEMEMVVNAARQMARGVKRKRSLSTESNNSKSQTKRSRYSIRTIELLKKQCKKETTNTLSSSPKIETLPKPKKVAPKKDDSLSLEERLERDFMTQTFDYWYLYSSTRFKKEQVCRLCFQPKDLVKCVGNCQGWYHSSCTTKEKNGQDIPKMVRKAVGEKKKTRKKTKIEDMSTYNIDLVKTEDTKVESTVLDFKCYKCTENLKEDCFICNQSLENEDTQICQQNSCGRQYHLSCVLKFPQADTEKKLICPMHRCHTCFASDLGDQIVPEGKLTTCIFCPVAYHQNDINCIPAGSEWITATKIICPAHTMRLSAKVNTDDCNKCGGQGNLVCCDECPAAFHAQCIGLTTIPENKFICDICKYGRKPLYNEIVWAKLAHYRWWPAIILPPQTVPLSIIQKFHYTNDFCVRFFGSLDFAWLSTDRVFPFQEGDENNPTKNKNARLDAAFDKALKEAAVALIMVNKQKHSIQQVKHAKNKPASYQRIKTNKAVPPATLGSEKINQDLIDDTCKCSPTDSHPCGLNSNCLNRAIEQECTSKTCLLNEKCENRFFTQMRYPKMDVVRKQGKGWGLVAAEDISMGEFVIEYVGEVIDTKEKNSRMKRKLERKDDCFYFMGLSSNRWIDAELKGNNARFMNHSCDPNCATQKWTVGNTDRIGLFALKDIKQGEELTFDYMMESEGETEMACLCNSGNCRGFITQKKKRDKREETPVSTDSKKISKNRLSKNKMRKTAKKSIKVPMTNNDTSVGTSTDNVSKIIIEDLEIRSENFVSF